VLFARVAASVPEARLVVVGQWDPAAIRNALAQAKQAAGRVLFAGPQTDLTSFLFEAEVCVHLGRGDAFPLSTLEAMCAGLPTIVSRWTGTREAVAQVDPSFVLPLNADEASARILAYLALPNETKRQLSDAFRSEGLRYTEQAAIGAFRTAVSTLLEARRSGLAH